MRYKTYLCKGKSYETSYENIVSWSQTLCLPSLGVCFSAQMTENRNYDWAADNEHDSVKEFRESGKKKTTTKKCHVALKSCMKILFHYPHPFFSSDP